MLWALALIALTQRPGAAPPEPCGIEGPIFCGGASFAFFEFAPVDGTGMGAACACTKPTGAKGEVMTFARASSGTCLKGNTLAGITNTDLVTCTSDQARVMPGGDGTGGNGLLIEGARTNVALRSQELENVAWTPAGSGVAAPTVTANQAVAPDGTTTAERVQFNGTTGAQFSVISQTAGSGAFAGSVFVKGVSGSGSLTVDCHNGAADSCVACAYNNSTWSRCTCAGAVGTPLLIFGPNSAGCFAGAADAADDVYLWGGQIEVGATVSSYIATTAATVTRAVDSAQFSVASGSAAGSAAATAVGQYSVAFTERAIFALSNVGPIYGNLPLPRPNAGIVTTYLSAGTFNSASLGWTTNAPYRLAFFWNGSSGGLYDGPTLNPAAGLTIAATTLLELGSYSGPNSPAFAVIKQVCVDPSPSRCR